LLKRRLSNPRAVTTIALAAVVAAAVAVTPSFAGSFLVNQKASGLYLTSKKASKQYLSNKKASSLYLKKKAASNTFVQKATAPLAPVAGIAAGTAQYGPTATVATPVAGYIPTAFTSFATKGNGPAVITFSGNVVCTAAKPTADVACPIEILIDGQKTGKINFAPATAESPAPAALVQSVTLTTVLQKGGHTVAVQYLGSSKAAFMLKGWNLAVQAYPQLPEPAPTTTETGTTGK
jgi:hypothetical protein